VRSVFVETKKTLNCAETNVSAKRHINRVISQSDIVRYIHIDRSGCTSRATIEGDTTQVERRDDIADQEKKGNFISHRQLKKAQDGKELDSKKQVCLKKYLPTVVG
jgi:hypothetical protein